MRQAQPPWRAFSQEETCARGPAYVVDAIAAGKRAADAIGKYLRGEPVEPYVAEKAPESLPEAEVTSLKSTIESLPRIEAPEEAPEARVDDFREVELSIQGRGGQARGRPVPRKQDRGVHRVRRMREKMRGRGHRLRNEGRGNGAAFRRHRPRPRLRPLRPH